MQFDLFVRHSLSVQTKGSSYTVKALSEVYDLIEFFSFSVETNIRPALRILSPGFQMALLYIASFSKRKMKFQPISPNIMLAHPGRWPNDASISPNMNFVLAKKNSCYIWPGAL